ncbi:hypothetical protein BKA60DRAFT_500849 [Fusarium oxysporum]|nr:hypothetical protein BKA60DRAFT_500849 [Fusarium oxysporum]
MEGNQVQSDSAAGFDFGFNHESSTSAFENKTESNRVQSDLTTGFDFEFHYDESSTTGRVLTHILLDLASFKAPQDWDNRQHMSQLKMLTASAKRYIENVSSGEASELINYSTVEDVFILNDTVTRRPVDSSTSTYFFPSKFNFNDVATASTLDSTQELHWSRGRIVQIAETASLMQRSPLLLLHAFCLRLQNEDTAFIREFIQRHVDFRHTLKTPTLFQPMTPSDTDADTRTCYRRLSYSCHIPHLLLQDISNHAIRADLPDLKLIEPFKHLQLATPKDSMSLCQVSSSVLLTFFLPEESASRREELDFLIHSRVLWNILTVNCVRRRSSSSDENHQAPSTPVAQFLGGIYGAIQTQKIDEQNILDALKSRLAESDDRGLFDDIDFTKSHLYHWVIKTCDMVCHSISTTLRFVERLSNDFVKTLGTKSHASDRPGIEFWLHKWMQEVSDLKDLREEFLSCRQNVQERRNALYGATAVLEARLAYQQGERIKVLTYLAIIYLPLGTSASIYSINPLPESATLASYFVFLIVLFLVTALTGVVMTKLSTQTSAALGSSGGFVGSWRTLLAYGLSFNFSDGLADYFRYLEAVFTPPASHDTAAPRGFTLISKFQPPAVKYWEAEETLGGDLIYLFYILCFLPLHHFVIPWMAWPRTLLYRWAYYRFRTDYTWSPSQAILDILVILSSPIAVVLFLFLTTLLVLIDITAAIWYYRKEVGMPYDVAGLEEPGQVLKRMVLGVIAVAVRVRGRIRFGLSYFSHSTLRAFSN